MPFKFNPFTDKLDLVDTSSISPGTVQFLEGNDNVQVGPDASGVIFTPVEWGGTTENSAANTESWYVYNCAKWIVDPTANRGTHTTISAAITAASAGDTIFIRPGTYTEDLTLKAGVNLTAFECDGTGLLMPTAHVNIVGKVTASYNGMADITGVTITTNSDFGVVVSAATAQLNLFNCFFNATNNTFFSLTASGALNAFYCNGNLGTTGIAYVSMSQGTFFINQGFYNNVGASTTASTVSGGVFDILYSVFANPITTSGNAQFYSHFTIYEGVGNTTNLTVGSTDTHLVDFCTYNSGTASAISISAGCALTIKNCEITSSNTNAITGAGTLTRGPLTFISSSSTINTTTQVFLQTDVSKYVAPGQPRFSANSAAATNCTGDGTAFTIGSSGTAWTEVYDVGGNFNTNGTYTAPNSGQGPYTYHFIGSVGLTGIDATNTGVVVQIVTSNRSYTGFTCAPFPISVGGALVLNFSCDADMDAGDTAVFQVTVFGAGKNVSVQGNAANTFFQGRLVC